MQTKTKKFLALGALMVTIGFLLQIKNISLAANDAVLSLSASPSTVAVNGTTTVTVRLNTGTNTNVTTVKATLNFDPTAMQVVGTPAISSAFALIAKNTADNTGGKIELAAGSSTPQSGDSISFASFTVKALKAGNFNLAFDANNSTVLINDRDNTNVLGATQPASLTVTAAPTCSDGVKNQDETDVDCGGVCAACQTSGSSSNGGGS